MRSRSACEPTSPIKDKVIGQSGPEIDPYGSFIMEIVKDKLTILRGFTLCTYVNAVKANGFYKETFEPNVALNWTPIDGWKLTPKVYCDVILSQLTLETNIAYTLPLKDTGTQLDFATTSGTFEATDAAEDTTPAVRNWGNY